MTNKEKSICILRIIMQELNMPENSTIGDVARALSIVDPDDEVMGIFKKVLTSAVVDEIKAKL